MASEQSDDWKMARIELGVCCSYMGVGYGGLARVVVVRWGEEDGFEIHFGVRIMGSSYHYRKINVDIQHLYHFFFQRAEKIFHYSP